MQLDSVVVGHVTVDLNVFPHGAIESVLGGTPTYAGFALTSLGKEVGVCAKIGKDFPEYFPPIFSKFGLNTEGILATQGNTTKFENTYNEKEERKQVCKDVSDSISPGDIPQAYLNASSFYISPVAGEVPAETVSKISGLEGISMIDPQGIFRKISDSGDITLERPDNLENYLSGVDIVKIGKDELQIFDETKEELLERLVEMGPKVAILTLGGEGCKIFSDGKITDVRSLKVNVEDPTGAGDVFGAAFLSKFLETENPIKSAKFANAAAGLKIEYKGPTGFPSEEEVKKAEEYIQ